MGRTSSRKRKSWWKTCNFPRLHFSILQILSEEDHLIFRHFVVEVLVSTHLYFNLISWINLLSMDIDSLLALPHPNQTSVCIGVKFISYHRNYLWLKYFPKCTLSFLACIFICVIIMYIFIPAFFKREGWIIFVRVSAVVGSKA